MDFRSTNDNYVHFQGDVVSNVNSSHGVHLRGGSSGGIIQPASDDTSAALNLRGKGPSGILNLGTSSGGAVVFNGSSLNLGSTHVNITSTRVSLGGGASTTAISGFQRVRVDFPVPEMAANAAGTSTHTAVGLSTNSVMMFASDALLAVWPNTVEITAKCSTTDELRLIFRNIAASSIGTGLSTSHGYLGWFNF